MCHLWGEGGGEEAGEAVVENEEAGTGLAEYPPFTADHLPVQHGSGSDVEANGRAAEFVLTGLDNGNPHQRTWAKVTKEPHSQS